MMYMFYNTSNRLMKASLLIVHCHVLLVDYFIRAKPGVVGAENSLL